MPNSEKVEYTESMDNLSDVQLDAEIHRVASALQEKHTRAQKIVKKHMAATIPLGLLPLPLVDIAALTATQLNLIRSLSKVYTFDFDEQKSKAVVTSLVGGSLPVLMMLGLSSFAKILPGMGTIGGGVSMAVLSGAITYATGQVFIHHFDRGGTLEDLDSKQWQGFFKQKFEVGKLQLKMQLNPKKLPL